jgi:hypothetical protein
MSILNKKAKIELTEEQKETMELEKQARACKRKETIKKWAKGTALVAAGFVAGAGSTLAYQKFSGNKDENVMDDFGNDDIGNVFAENRNEEVA